MGALRISQVAERVGVPATTLRFYEQSGLVAPGRSPSGYRLYDDEAVDRLRFIAAAKLLGLSLEEIRELLGVWEHGVCHQVQDRLRPLLQARVVQAEQRTVELVEFAARLTEALGRLAGPSRPGRCDPSCEFLLTHRNPPAALPVVQEACRLPEAGRDVQLADWEELADAAVSVVPVAGGVRVTLAVKWLEQAARVAAAEQRCCPFYEIRLDLAGPVVHLEVRAADPGAEVLTALRDRAHR